MTHAGAFVSGNDAPRIDARAAARGRSATEGGGEHVGVESAGISPVFANVPRRNARGARHDQGHAHSRQ
jgi:hypothetical protein